MTRAEDILEKIGDPKPPGKATSPFKHQYSFKPGAKTPTHMKLRKDKLKLRMQRSKKVYTRPWSSSDKPAQDKVSKPLTNQTNKTPIHKIG